MPSQKTWVIAYDISAQQRLVKVHKLLSKQAFALQYSVFIADLTDIELSNIMKRIKHIIDEEVDDVRFYQTTGKTQFTVLGPGRLPEGVMVFGIGASGIANSHNE